MPVSDAIFSAIRATVGAKANLHEPLFEGNEADYVKECIDTKWVSSAGKFVDRFEQILTDFTGISSVATMNGTAALHICLRMAGVKEGDEVLVPTLTFVATANAVTYCGAEPHFVDSEENSLGVDASKLDAWLKKETLQKNGECFNKKTGKRIPALIAMHTYGHPVDLDAIKATADRHHIVLIEDAAESLGSFYKKKHTGFAGKFSCLSFNGNKIVTTGGGGAVMTADPKLAQQIKHLTTTAKAKHPWNFYHDAVGFNYRLPNLNAALGCAQLETLPKMLEAKRKLATRYQKNFEKIEGVRFFKEPSYAKSNYWLNVLLLDSKNSGHRDAVLAKTNESGLMTRPAWVLMHKLPMFKSCPKMDLSIAEDLERRILNIPSSAFL